jgi:hypothetical protein
MTQMWFMHVVVVIVVVVDYDAVVSTSTLSGFLGASAYPRKVPVTFVVSVRPYISARLPLGGFS